MKKENETVKQALTDLSESTGINKKAFITIKEENEGLLKKIKLLEVENKELKEKLSGTKGEREVIIDKITKILEKIEKTEV